MASAILGDALDLTLLDVPGKCQDRALWCWAACAATVVNAYPGGSNLDQLAVVSATFGSACSRPRVRCPDHLDSDRCDLPFNVGCALCLVGCTSNPRGRPRAEFLFQDLQIELSRGLPVVAGGGAHFVVIIGCATVGGVDYIGYLDSLRLCMLVSQFGFLVDSVTVDFYWTTTPPACRTRVLPENDAQKVSAFTDQISRLRQPPEAGILLSLFELDLQSAASEEPLQRARRWIRKVLSATLSYDFDASSARVSSAMSGVDSINARVLYEGVARVDGEPDVISVPSLSVRALRQADGAYLPVAAVPPFLQRDSAPTFTKDDLMTRIRGRATSLLAQLEQLPQPTDCSEFPVMRAVCGSGQPQRKKRSRSTPPT